MARLGGLFQQGFRRRFGGDADAARAGVLTRRAREMAAGVERLAGSADAQLAANSRWPLHTDWAWRPEAWSGQLVVDRGGAVSNGSPLGSDAKFFLDCRQAEIAVRQIDGKPDAVAPQAIAIEVSRFEGSFFSLAAELPGAALNGLSRRHLLRIGLDLEAKRHIAVYARLNLRQGPNVLQLVRRFEGEAHVDLDLAVSDLDEERLSDGWVDLIFEAPLATRMVLADVTVSRRPRAAL
ncbi:MAG: hypothetical protein EX266_13075 [Rhodobacteraceae bacterium]|nr:MAG: hypothetical protein EX266_13075 [Paracoccaceae bacterium]